MLVSHEAFCILNTTDSDAHVDVTIYYADREPVGPYSVLVPARRVRHFRFNDLDRPEKTPHGTTYASLIESDVPVVAPHTRPDSRQADERAALHHGIRRRLRGGA